MQNHTILPTEKKCKSITAFITCALAHYFEVQVNFLVRWAVHYQRLFSHCPMSKKKWSHLEMAISFSFDGGLHNK
jgi:hypothetical protein